MKKWKRNIKNREIVFLVVIKTVFFAKLALLGKIAKHYWFSEGENRAFSLTLSVFGKCQFFVTT